MPPPGATNPLGAPVAADSAPSGAADPTPVVSDQLPADTDVPPGAGIAQADTDPPATVDPESITFWSLTGAPLPGLTEWQPALVALPVPVASWERVRLTLQGQEWPIAVRKLGGRARVVAEWPRSGPGRYLLTITIPGESKPLARTTQVTIQPAKLSPAAFATLLDDLEHRLPVAIAIGLQRAGGLIGVTLPPPGESTLAQEVARLRRVVVGVPGERPGLTAILASLTPDPHHLLRGNDTWTPQHRARRPAPARLARALTRPGNWDGTAPAAVVDHRIIATVDVYENRLVATLVQQVSQRLRRLLNHQSLPADLGVEVRSLLATVDLARHAAPWLAAVSQPRHLPIRPSMVLLKRPSYRAALVAYLELRRSVAVHLDAPDLSAPLTNLPALYQLWGTLCVIDTLLTVATAAGFTLHHERLTRRDAAGLFLRVLPDGVPALMFSRPDGAALRLIPEATYGPNYGLLRSLSFSQRPDIVVEFTSGPGRDPVLIVFDPKYKLDGEGTLVPDPASLSGPPGDVDSTLAAPAASVPGGKPQKGDIDKMHAYRDAIRTADGVPVVAIAAILYPGPTVYYGPAGELAALHAVPGDPAPLVHALATILGDLVAH